MLRNSVAPAEAPPQPDGTASQTDATTTSGTDATTTAGPVALVSLLGEARATIVTELHRRGDRRIGDLAACLGVSEVATRRHLGVLEDEGLVEAREVVDGPGRPAKHWSLTDRAIGLFPQRYATMAEELLEFLVDQHGRDGLRTYLQWRRDRQAADLAGQVTADDLEDRLGQLADALSEAGFDATVDVVGDRYVLRQDHCTIYDVARDHPEMCAFEAATFSRVLGRDVRISRQQTRADGSDSCVCCVTPRGADAPPPERRLPVLVEQSDARASSHESRPPLPTRK